MTLRLSHWVWVALLLSASIMLYHTSYKVQEQEEQLVRIKAAQKSERETIHVLEAEWAMLTSPSRLQRLADKFLDLKPVSSKQIVGLHRLDRVLARRDTATTHLASNGEQRLALSVVRGADAR